MYEWTEEQQAIIDVVRRFVDEEIRPQLDDSNTTECRRTRFFARCTTSLD